MTYAFGTSLFLAIVDASSYFLNHIIGVISHYSIGDNLIINQKLSVIYIDII